MLDSFVAAVNNVAASSGCAVLDLKNRWISYASANTYLPYFDSLHPGVLGYQDIAQAMFGVISNV